MVCSFRLRFGAGIEACSSKFSGVWWPVMFVGPKLKNWAKDGRLCSGSGVEPIDDIVAEEELDDSGKAEPSALNEGEDEEDKVVAVAVVVAVEVAIRDDVPLGASRPDLVLSSIL